MISPTTETGWIAVVDLVAKVAYGLVFSRDSTTIAAADLRRGEVVPAPVVEHPVPSDAQRS